MKRVIGPILLVACIAGCAHRVRNESVRMQEQRAPKPVAEHWTEPMPDVVKVPGGLDPTGTYYMPEHNEVVEIRPDRYQEVDYDKKSKKK